VKRLSVLVFAAVFACDGGDEPVAPRRLGHCYRDEWVPCEVDVPEVGYCTSVKTVGPVKGQVWTMKTQYSSECASCPMCETNRRTK
jgi:hypothetical protein